MVNTKLGLLFIICVLVITIIFVPLIIPLLSLEYHFYKDCIPYSKCIFSFKKHITPVEKNYGEAIQLLIAIGTIGAVSVALFQKTISKIFYRPKLKVCTNNKGPWCISVPQFDAIPFPVSIPSESLNLDIKNSTTESLSININDLTITKKPLRIHNGNAIFLRIKVKNKGNIPAKHVEVFAKNIRCINRHNRYNKYNKIECKSSVPLAMDLQWGNTGDAFYPRIHPDTEKYCNIGFLTTPSSRKLDPRYYYNEEWESKYEINETALLINVKYPLAKGDHIVGPGKYELDIVITAVDAKPVKKTIVIEFDQWNDNEEEMLKTITLKFKNLFFCEDLYRNLKKKD